ncbi:hypothetical protein [Kaistia defluvii]|uniref:Uncharacterized protein n=1 Tax=Kaistia defluvii TaxID=410841 RepID=A0ABV2R2K2_9HYPH
MALAIGFEVEMTWHSDRYFAKAQRYWERNTASVRDAEQFLLQLSFVVEFVARGALVHQHPSLNAELDEESLLFSNGIAPRKPARSVGMDKAISRCQRLVADLSEEEVQAVRLLFDTRNEELHGDGDALSSVPVKDVSFKPQILSFIVKMSRFAGQDIEVLMGSDDGKQAVATSAALAHNRKERVRQLINIHKDRFYGLPKAQQDDLRKNGRAGFQSAVMKSGHHILVTKCPACGSDGYLGGRPVGVSAPILEENEIFQEVRVVPEIFECKVCDLMIKGLDELMAAKFDHEFVSRQEVDPVEHFGIDPMDYVDTEEIAREYNHQFEYQDE